MRSVASGYAQRLDDEMGKTVVCEGGLRKKKKFQSFLLFIWVKGGLKGQARALKSCRGKERGGTDQLREGEEC